MLTQTSMQSIRNWAGKCAIVLLAMIALLSGCAPPGPQTLLDGKRLLDEGKYPQAIAKLEMATTLLATNVQASAAAWNFLGLAYQHSGNGAKADAAYRQALKLDPKLAEAHYNRGCLWLGQPGLEIAKGEFTAYTLSRGDSVDGFLMLGNVQLLAARPASVQARGRELEAVENSFNQALQLSPQNPEALNGLGMAKVQRGRAGDISEAEKYFKAALNQRPGYAPALLNLAILSQQYSAQPAIRAGEVP